MTSADSIRFEGAGKRFDDTWVLRDVDLAVPDGTILGLIGPSGSGKTTAVRLANGVYLPDSGEVRLFGKPPTELSPDERRSIAYLPQQPVLFESLSLWENLNFHASLNGVRFRRRRRLRAILELVDLLGEEGKLVRESSGGMRRRIALAAALTHGAPLLMLDEPTAGIDPVLRRRFWEHFRALRDVGHTLLVCTQYIGEAADCDMIALLANGEMIALGTPEELKRSAFGGDVIEIEIDRFADREVADLCAELSTVRSAEAIDPQRLRLVVDDAGVAVPAVLQRFERSGIKVIESEAVAPDYDDVFIRLLERAETASPR